MARPNRVRDQDLADRLREQMRIRGWTGSDVAQMLGVNKGTISRALSSSSFSPALRPHVAMLVDSEEQSSVADLLQKSLHKLKMSDIFRRDAEVMISKALDLTRQSR